MPNNIENNRHIESTSKQKETPTRIEIRDHITRNDVRAEPDKIFLFGDNLVQKGFGGQAKEMRGEANSIGIPTKKSPSNDPKSFFNDHDFDANKKAIDEAFQKIPPEKTIVIPKAGLGTGLAQMPQKSPKTFVYLNQKLAEIGFRNQDKDSREIQTNIENKVLVQNPSSAKPTAKRLLNLNDINTASLKTLSPTAQEIDALKIDSRLALTDYAERLRQDYKTNKDGFREGMQILSDSLEKGEQITITCSCRDGSLCHADVVKMAVEKVSTRIKNTSVNKVSEAARGESLAAVQENSNAKQISQAQNLNPRTQKAINEILSFSENDRILEKIDQTDGRNRSEQASHLGKSSQFTRDLYEHGGHIADGYLIVPKEKLSNAPILEITTESYAVDRINNILKDESKSKELAPVIVEYGNKIAGVTADRETKLKVFGWIYDSLEGKSALLAQENGEKATFAETMEKISLLAEEMYSLEPIDKTEFVPLVQIEKNHSAESSSLTKGETLNLEEIYEEAINPPNSEQSFELETGEKINTEGFERIDLNQNIPRIPEDYTRPEIFELFNETLPEIDRQLENGIPQKEILASFNQAIRNSASVDAQKRLETIYQKQNQTPRQSKEKSSESSQSLDQQLVKIDLRRQNVIEIKTPTEYLQAEKDAITTFYRRQKQEIGLLLTKIDESRQTSTSKKNEEIILKKELKQIRDTTPNFAYKLENSAEIVLGIPSRGTVEKRNFVSSYINYQLEKPETRLRYEHERYRSFASRLDSATTRDEVMKTSAEIRAENAKVGQTWKDLPNSEKEKLPRPLTNREMQFLFTESSPAHYTNEMTAIRLSYAHSGTSRRQMTESLLKGEIRPSPEAQKLVESLEARLQRRDIQDSLFATRHFFESIKIPNESLKYKNKFDHQEIYQKLPPAEKDFVYQKASQQKENLEYQLAFKKAQLKETTDVIHGEQSIKQVSQAETAFHLHSLYHQARILGERLDSIPLTGSEIKAPDVSAIAVLLNNQPPEKLKNLAASFQISQNPEKQKIAEVIQTFARAEISQSENKTTVSIKLPENRLISTDTYRELLEKFYPDNLRENNKFKFENIDKKEMTQSREKGQNEALKNFRDEIQTSVYQNDDSGKVIETTNSVLEKLDEIARFQSEARIAKGENKRLILKYAARVSGKMEGQSKDVPTALNQQKIISAALGLSSANIDSNKVQSQFLTFVQKEITIADFEKFTVNEELLSDAKATIKNEFAEISKGLQVLEESKLPISKNVELNEKDQNPSLKAPNQETVVDKPLSLSIFEKELEKAESELIKQGLKEKLVGDPDLEKNLDPKNLFSNDERTAIKSAAIELVKEKLEPKELNTDHRKISREASQQAFATYKQLERAARDFQTTGDKSKISESFFKLDDEASKLNEIRQDYHRNENMAILRNGIKTDLADFLKKNQALKPNNFEGEINKILLNNLNKTDFVKIVEDEKQVSILSRQIAKKLEAKQIFNPKEKGLTNETRSNNVSRINSFASQNDYSQTNQFEKLKDAPVLTR